METFSSKIQRFASEHEPSGKKEQRGVQSRVTNGEDTIDPGNGFVVVDDQVADVEPFKMRYQEIDCIDDSSRWFGHLQGDLIEVSANQQDAGYENKTNRGIGRGRCEDNRAQQNQANNHAEHGPLKPQAL